MIPNQCVAFANISGTEDIKNSDVLVQVQNETFCKTRTEIILTYVLVNYMGQAGYNIIVGA